MRILVRRWRVEGVLTRVEGAGPRRATNITLPEDLLQEAKALGINLSQACERGLAAEVEALRRRRWLEENREAMEAWNAHVAEHGLPLESFRTF
jgi:antitoxin CcdA